MYRKEKYIYFVILKVSAFSRILIRDYNLDLLTFSLVLFYELVLAKSIC